MPAPEAIRCCVGWLSRHSPDRLAENRSSRSLAFLLKGDYRSQHICCERFATWNETRLQAAMIHQPPLLPEPPPGVDAPPAARVIASDLLFAGAQEIVIRHDDTFYRLRITRAGKLILTK
jgi:hemin uptake protein HemP